MAIQKDNKSPRYTPSNQIDDLIGHPPGCLLKSGIFIVAIVVCILLLFCAFFKYPDKIVAKGIMTSLNPPIEHVNQTAGIIEEIYYKNGDTVRANDTLLYIKNNTNIGDVKMLMRLIDEYQSIQKIADYKKFVFPKGLQLGELQSDYSQLQLLFSQYQQTIKQSAVYLQIEALENEIESTVKLRDVLAQGKGFSNQEKALKEKEVVRNRQLNSEGLISDLDLERVESEWLRYQNGHSNLDRGIIEYKIKEEQLRLASQKLVEERVTKEQSHTFEIAKSINAIESGIADWKEKYFVVSEVEGELSFVPNLSLNQFVPINSVLLSVIQKGNLDHKEIRALVSNEGIGKVSTNDKAIVKIDGYPYKEFGVLVTKVSTISALPNTIQSQNGQGSNLYTISIQLPDTLVTNYDKVIEFRPNSSVTVEVITEDRSILERLFETFFALNY